MRKILKVANVKVGKKNNRTKIGVSAELSSISLLGDKKGRKNLPSGYRIPSDKSDSKKGEINSMDYHYGP